MNPEELEQGFVALNQLAESEYRKSLQQLLSEPPGTVDPWGRPEDQPALQIGRLIGVLLKQPFATPQDLSQPSQYSGAYRAWELLAEVAFNEPARRSTWQYQVLQQLTLESGLPEVYVLAVDAAYERGFFGYLGRSTAKYVCGDAKIRREIKKAVDEAKKAGLNVSVTSPELVVGSAGLSLGVMLIQYVPVLGVVGAPVIAGLVLIIYRIGVDAFCDWIRDHLFDAPLESTR